MQRLAPWERQPGEIDTAWAAFRAWRDSAYPNGVAQPPIARPTARQFGQSGAAYAVTSDKAGHWVTVASWAAEYQWHARAQAYDRYLDGERLKVGTGEIAELKKARAKAIRDLSRIAELERAKILRLSERDETDPVNLRDLLALEELLGRYTRLEAGEPTERTAASVDLSTWPTESLQAMHDLLKKNGA